MPIWTPQDMTPEGAQYTGTQSQRIRSEFPVAPRDDVWDVVTAPSQTFTAGQTTQGSVLAIACGTTANATSWIISDQPLVAPFRVQASIQLSQKIVNQSVFLEVVGWDPINGVTIEGQVATWCLTGNDNTTATNATYEVQNALGTNKVRAVNQTVPTYVGALTATAPVTTFEIEHLVDEVWFHAKSSDSVNNRNNSYKRETTVPDPSRQFKVRVRVVNGGTAPASATTVYLGHVSAESYAENAVELVSSRGSSAAGQALPVFVTNSPTTTTSASSVAGLTANASQVAPTLLRIDALTNAVQSIKASANAYLYGAVIYNPNAAMSAVHFYNTTGAETVGTTVPVLTVAVPPTSTLVLPVSGLPYLKNATGLRVVSTTTATTAGAVAPTTPLTATFMFL